MPYTHPLFSRRFDGSRTISTVLDGLDAFLRDLDQSGGLSWPRGFAPAEGSETDTSYAYTLVLPGFKRDQVTVEEAEGDLTVTAISRHANRKATRTISLPTDADPSKVEAKLEDGILSIVVQKLAKPTPPAPRKVTVS